MAANIVTGSSPWPLPPYARSIAAVMSAPQHPTMSRSYVTNITYIIEQVQVNLLYFRQIVSRVLTE